MGPEFIFLFFFLFNTKPMGLLWFEGKKAQAIKLFFFFFVFFPIYIFFNEWSLCIRWCSVQGYQSWRGAHLASLFFGREGKELQGVEGKCVCFFSKKKEIKTKIKKTDRAVLMCVSRGWVFNKSSRQGKPFFFLWLVLHVPDKGKIRTICSATGVFTWNRGFSLFFFFSIALNFTIQFYICRIIRKGVLTRKIWRIIDVKHFLHVYYL